MQPPGRPPDRGDAGGPEPGDHRPARDDTRDSDDRGWVRQLATLGHVGMMFPVAIAIGFLGGRWLDSYLGTQPWLSLLGFVLGVTAALRNLIQAVSRLDSDERQDRETQIERRRRERRGPDTRG